MPLPIRILDVSLHLTDCRARIPFRFGIHTMTAAPLCLARVLVEDRSGRRMEGFSSDLLVPKWFEKNPDQSIADDWQRLLQCAQEAAQTALDSSSCTAVFDHWLRVYEARVRSAPPEARDLLVRGEGVSLIERALMDAACRLAEATFHDAWLQDLFGFSPDLLLPELSGWDALRTLPAAPPSLIAIRHTIGLLDTLSEADLDPDQRINDGLPESLEADIRRYGLTHFKIKLSGDTDADIDRLRAVGAVLSPIASPLITFDGNEQFESVEQLNSLLRQLSEDPRASSLLEHLRYIEQPLARSQTFEPEPNRGLDRLPWPCLIDEADFNLESFPRAIELGYRGVSIKNCKGVFRAMINRARCEVSELPLFQSAEDLTNLPIIALQQDLATASLLGMTHVERNGHHYFDGLKHLPPSEQQAAMARHDDLYAHGTNGPQLVTREGALSLRSIQVSIGYAYDVPIDVQQRTALDAWSPISLL